MTNWTPEEEQRIQRDVRNLLGLSYPGSINNRLRKLRVSRESLKASAKHHQRYEGSGQPYRREAVILAEVISRVEESQIQTAQDESE